MKMKRPLIIFLLFLMFVGLLIWSRFYYLEHVKYVNLEQELKQIHMKMEADFPKELLEKAEHFGAGLSIRNTYGLWKEDTKIRKEFEKAGVELPDDMSGIIMETYIRSKKGIPFKLHRLIALQTGFYKAEDKQKYLKKLVDEFYIYKQYSSIKKKNQQ